MRFKRAGLLTKLVILVLVVYATVTLVSLRSRIEDAEERTAAIAAQVEAKQLSNEALAYDIAHSGDPETMENVARSKLGLVLPGEQVFYDVSNR